MSFERLKRHSSESVPVEHLDVLLQPLQVPVHPFDLPANLLDLARWVASLDCPVEVNLHSLVVSKKCQVC